MNRRSLVFAVAACALFAAIEVAGAQSAIEYEIVAPGHDWILSWSASDAERLYALTIANKAAPVTNLRPVQLGLRRTDGDSSIDLARLRMLTSPDGTPVGAIDLKANETKTIFLRLDPGASRGPFGTFSGSVQFAADGTAIKVVPLTAKVSSTGVKFAGALLVLVGLCLSVVLTNYLQPRLVRLQALRPAAVLRDLLLRFAADARLGAADDVSGIENEARRQAARLELRALDAEGLLPPRISLSTMASADAGSRLKQRLDEISGRLAGLILLRDAVLQLRSRGGAGQRPAAIADAIAQLNQAAPEAATADAARAIVARVLDSLRASAVADSVREVQPSSVDVEQLDFALEHTASIVWAIWALVSFAIGVTYVYSDVDFGTAVDLLGVFFWGFGLTTFGAGLQQLTPTSVAAHVGLRVPRSGQTRE